MWVLYGFLAALVLAIILPLILSLFRGSLEDAPTSDQEN